MLYLSISGVTSVRGLSRYIVMAYMTLVSACGNGASLEDDFYKEKMMENMKLASSWLIQEGIEVFFEKGRDGLHRKLVDEWGVSFWADPAVETDRYLARFVIHARGIHYDIHNLYRESISGEFYEFWLVKIVAKPWSGESGRSVFYVAISNDVRGRRKVLEQSDKFIESYQVDKSEVVNFPVNDLEVLYDMQAWLYPESYKHTNLSDRKVVVDESGNIAEE